MKYYGTSNGTDYGFSPSKNIFTSYVEIEESEYKSLFDGQSNGKQIKHDESGKPYLSDYDTTPTAEQQITELQTYLKNTDWYAIRYAETGTEIPDGITKKRQEMRNKISELRLT